MEGEAQARPPWPPLATPMGEWLLFWVGYKDNILKEINMLKPFALMICHYCRPRLLSLLSKNIAWRLSAVGLKLGLPLALL